MTAILGEHVLEDLGTGQAHLAASWLPHGGRILEVGCSSGYLTRRFTGKAAQIFGVDINFRALVAAKRRHPNSPLVCSEAECLPLADSSFDTIVMLEVIEHTSSDAAAIAEIRRVLKPGGTLILSTPNAGLFAFLDPFNVRKTIQRRWPFLYRIFSQLASIESGQFTDNLERHRHYRLDELSKLLGQGFAMRRVYRGGLFLYPVIAACISVAGRLSDNPALLRWLYRILNWDFKHRFGRFSYNLMILAERVR